MRKTKSLNQESLPLDIAGSSTFGRYAKISDAKTINMMISDEWLVGTPGWKMTIPILLQGAGRRIYSSSRFGKMIAVINENVYVINPNLTYALVGKLETFSGDVFIDENNTYQIGICDKKNVYIYNWSTNVFSTAITGGGPTLDFLPGYITYQDTYFICPNIQGSDNDSTWRLSNTGNGLSFPDDAQHVGNLQTKADYAIAAVRAPSRGNLLFLFGNTVTEYWYDVGGQLFPYTRSTNANIDFGCANVATIAALDSLICWLGINEKTGPVIMYSTGGEISTISTDGINFQLAQLVNPKASFAFFMKQYGHLLYQITFYDPQDNLTLIYDFNTEKFFNVTDEHQNVSIVKNVAYFNNTYYFVSNIDGNIYELNSDFTTYDYGNNNVQQIPRIRVCSPIRKPDSDYFTISNITFPIEQGEDAMNNGNFPDYVPRIDLSLSKNGAISFGNSVSVPLNEVGRRKNRVDFWRLGIANDLTVQIRFWSTSRIVAANGEITVNP